jgi:hypothetical protein
MELFVFHGNLLSGFSQGKESKKKSLTIWFIRKTIQKKVGFNYVPVASWILMLRKSDDFASVWKYG